MAIPAVAPSEEPTEAVIISGPRRGQIVELPVEALQFSPEEEELLEQALASAERIAELARTIASDTRKTVAGLQERRLRERH